MKRDNKKSRISRLTDYEKSAYIKQTKQGELKVWTNALQTALDENDCVCIPKGKYYLDDSIILESNKEIRADKNAEIILLKSCQKLMLRNADVLDGSFTNISKSAPISRKITIKGGIWSESNTERLGYGKTGKFDDEDSLHGVSCTMLFSGVEDLVLKNMTFRNSAGFCIQVGRCRNFEIKNIKCENCFADGVHINGDVKNGYVYNIHGEVGDDLVALNAYDWDNSTINNGAIENVTVEKIYATGKGDWYKAFRIQPGVLNVDNGVIDCFIKDLYIKNVKGVSVFKMYLQTPAYIDKPDGASVGKMENINFENIEVNAVEPIDKLPNYLNSQPTVGHFGAFELGSNIKSVTFKNVKVFLNKEKYPLSHFITIGPKSQLMEGRGELFDPYVVSEVDKIVCKNIKINGKKVIDVRSEIYEIAFPDDLYENQYGKGGSGKFKELIS